MLFGLKTPHAFINYEKIRLETKNFLFKVKKQWAAGMIPGFVHLTTQSAAGKQWFEFPIY